MRRAIKDKLNGLFDDSDKSDEQRSVKDRVKEFVRDKGPTLVSTVQEHITSMTDTTGTLAKQKLLQTLLASGKIQSEHIRHGLQIGIGFFLDPSKNSSFDSNVYLHRQRFASVGGVTPPHNQPDFDIEAHGLELFLSLMNIFGIDCLTLRNQICQGELKEIVNPSSSGSLLYLTSDSSYLIKTLRDYDAKFIQQRFLQTYLQYVAHRRADTFIAKLLGVFGYIPYLSSQHNITVDSFALRFAIFSNFIPINLEIHEKYDLKGSTYRRDADIKERMKSSTTFKDNDFRDLHPNGLRIPRHIYEHLTEVLTRDVDFLQQLNIMDYSLLLIVHNIDNRAKVTRPGSLEALMGVVADRFLMGMNEQKSQRQQSNDCSSMSLLKFKKPMETLGFRSEEMPMFDVDYAREYGGIPAMNEKNERLLLFIGIIDILQTFDICKVMQRQYQTVENRDVVAERSIVEPDFYARRFRDFVFGQVFRPVDSIATPSRSSLYPSLPFPF